MSSKFSNDHSFDDPQKFPLVYIVTTTDDGTTLDVPATSPQNDGTVQLPFYMLCGSVCLSGKVYVLGKIDGAWRVTGNVGVEVTG